MKKYKEWVIEKYKGEDSEYGDLVGDILDDKHFPEENCFKNIYRHLKELDACSEAIEAFADTWVEYENDVEQK